MKTALITGIGGQDGSYLSELLLMKGYSVVGCDLNLVNSNLSDNIKNQIKIASIDLSSHHSISQVLQNYNIDEIYNFAAFSSGEGMFSKPIESGDINGLAITRFLEAIRVINPQIRFCQASSSEMFGNPTEKPQNENSPFHPRTPYGCAKLYAHNMIGVYRSKYRLHACSAILYNHESPRRGINYVTRKVTHAAASIKLGLMEKLKLGTLDANRDWGYAKDYVSAMHLMTIHSYPDDYVIATGKTHSIRELCNIAFSYLDLDYKKFVQLESQEYRTQDTIQLVGDASKAKSRLGWTSSIDFDQLIQLMVDHDIRAISCGNKGQSAQPL